MRRVWVREFGFLAGVDRDRTKLRERARARDVVVVDVRLQRVCDQNTETRRRGEIRVDLPVGVDEERDAGVGVGDEVARVPEPRVEELLDQHLARNLARARLRSRLLADRLRFFPQSLFAGTWRVIVRRDHRGHALIEALAL